MRTASYVVILLVATGCGEYNLYAARDTGPFVARDLLVCFYDYHTQEPVAGVRVERLIVMGKHWSWAMRTRDIVLGVQESSSDGTAIINIDQPGILLDLEKRGYRGPAVLTPHDRVYQDYGRLLTEYDGVMVVPMKKLSDLGKRTPTHPDWLPDEYKLPADWAEKKNKK